MSTLEKALEVLSKEYGQIDNVRLLLGDKAGMSVDSVADELCKLALEVQDGTIKALPSFAERKFAETTISF
jgi:hypothetical protein